MSIEITIPQFLQHLINDAGIVHVQGATVEECLDELTRRFPDLQEMLFTRNGKLLSFLDISINGKSAYPDHLARPVKDGDKLQINHIIVGG